MRADPSHKRTRSPPAGASRFAKTLAIANSTGGPRMSSRQISDSWERGSPYEKYVGRWSRQVAPKFLTWLQVPKALRWLDVGCGTGALCAAIADGCAPFSLIDVDPSEGFLKSAGANLGGRAVLYPGSATSIPLADASVDIVVSGLVLNFVPDMGAAISETTRVTASPALFRAECSQPPRPSWRYPPDSEFWGIFRVRPEPDCAARTCRYRPSRW